MGSINKLAGEEMPSAISKCKSPFKVRRPLSGDWDQVMALLKIANFHRIGGQEMRKFEPEDCFIADANSRIIGVAGYHILDKITAKTTLLTVAPDMRGRGVGAKLQQVRLAYLREKGMRHVYTNCDDPKVVAWNCRHFSFQPTGRILQKLEPYGRSDQNSWTNLRLELDSQSRDMLPNLPVGSSDDSLVHELTEGQVDAEMYDAVQAVVDAMHCNESGFLEDHFTPREDPENEVSEANLILRLKEDEWVSDIVEDRRLSNCIAYNFDNVTGAIMDRGLRDLRQHLDQIVLRRAQILFPGCPGLTVENTGHFWYPAGGYMGWHTNLRTPGWRCYINITEEPNKSFFRYRDPRDGSIVTSWDRTWNFRLFNITPTAPLWHAVYSKTNRISLGYKLILA